MIRLIGPLGVLFVLVASIVFAALNGAQRVTLDLGLFVFYGILGFTPFGTAAALLRNATRLFRAAKPGQRFAPVILGAILLATPPTIVFVAGQSIIREAVQVLRVGAPDSAAEASDLLSKYESIVYLDALVFRYEEIQHTKEAERIATAYQRVTGKEIDERLWELRD